ncbi:MAG: thioredoxin family protein [Phycisphaerales bacterium]
MARTPSTMLMQIGDEAPDFSLPDVHGRTVSLDDFRGADALLVMFICNHCPFVKHIRDGLARFARDYAERNVAVVAINSNDVANYPDDSPEKMAAEVNDAGYIFPYLFDETQDVAKAYRASCTPDFFLFDRDRRLFYRGQFDESRPGGDARVTGADMRGAIDAVLAGSEPPTDTAPSIGCNIKWKQGNEPDYFLNPA